MKAKSKVFALVFLIALTGIVAVAFIGDEPQIRFHDHPEYQPDALYIDSFSTLKMKGIEIHGFNLTNMQTLDAVKVVVYQEPVLQRYSSNGVPDWWEITFKPNDK